MKKTVFLLLLHSTLLAQKNNSSLLDSFMKAQVLVNEFNGNVLAAKSGNTIYQKAFGYRNYDTKEPLENNSVFELGSVSKQFTAMGILLLKEKGKLKLSDSLRKFFPELPYHNITIHHLLTHTSGLPEYEELMAKKWDRKKIAFNNDLIQVLAIEKPPVVFKSGEKWAYSNTSYALLASIIEKVSGNTFKEYMQQNIFKPLAMNDTRVYNTRRSLKEVIPNYAYGFVYSDSLKRYVLPDSLPQYDYVIYLDGIQGDGIINSTSGDLLKWDRPLKNYTLLSEATQKEMLTPQALIDTASKAAYGYGVFLSKNKFGSYITHSGGWPGYATNFSRNIDEDITIVVLSNNFSNSTAISNSLTYILFDEPIIFPYLHEETAIDSTLLGKYVGLYQGITLEDTRPIEIIKKDGKLYYVSGWGNVELKPESKNKFFSADKSDRQVEFILDKSEKIEKAWFINRGIKIEMKKIK